MTDRPTFSCRHGYRPTDAEITVREDAPESLRCALLAIAHDDLGMAPRALRSLVCSVLRRRPDSRNWSEYPNVWDEVQCLVYDCEWYRVYDIIEALHQFLADRRGPREAHQLRQAINACFGELGIGWQVDEDGKVVTRGDQTREALLSEAVQQLEEMKLLTARSELEEAVRDLSRRPEPDASGAVQHAMAALECAAREATEERELTLGQIVKRHPDLFPSTVGQAVSKLYGYASDAARHVREGQRIAREEAELLVSLAASLAAYVAVRME